MTILTKENYNKNLKSGDSILMMLDDPGDPNCVVAKAVLKRIDQMHGKDFMVAVADITKETEILKVLEPDRIPAFIAIKNRTVKRKIYGIPTENELLDMIRI